MLKSFDKIRKIFEDQFDEKRPEEIKSEKEYFGSKGDSQFFYFLRKKSETTDEVEDLQIIDTEDKVLFSAKEMNLPIEDEVGFLKTAIQNLDIDQVSYSLVMKYDLLGLKPKEEEIPKAEEPKTEEPKEEPKEEELKTEESKIKESGYEKITNEILRQVARLAKKKFGIEGDKIEFGEVEDLGKGWTFYKKTSSAGYEPEYFLSVDGKIWQIIDGKWSEMKERTEVKMKTKRSKCRKISEDYKDVGSGKLPNKYYVTGSSDFYIQDPDGDYVWASEVLPEYSNVKVEEYGVFDTYKEARAKVDELAKTLPEKPSPSTINSYFIEDHISGEIFHIGIYARRISDPYEYLVDGYEDVEFTKSKLEAQGIKFESVEKKDKSFIDSLYEEFIISEGRVPNPKDSEEKIIKALLERLQKIKEDLETEIKSEDKEIQITVVDGGIQITILDVQREEPKIEEPKVEEPRVEEPKAEEPEVEVTEKLFTKNFADLAIGADFMLDGKKCVKYSETEYKCGDEIKKINPNTNVEAIEKPRRECVEASIGTSIDVYKSAEDDKPISAKMQDYDRTGLSTATTSDGKTVKIKFDDRSRKWIIKESEINEMGEPKRPGALKKDAVYRSRGKCVFPAEHPKVKDLKDHFPINNIRQARNALARVAQYDSAPEWFAGSLAELQKAVRNAVKKEYPSIEVSECKEVDSDYKETITLN